MISNVVIFDKLLDLLCALGEEGVYLDFFEVFSRNCRVSWCVVLPFIMKGIDRIKGKK